MPDATEARQRCQEFEQRSTAAVEALTTSGGQAIEEIREDGVELSDQGRRFTLRATR
jgi:hypothetical protein